MIEIGIAVAVVLLLVGVGLVFYFKDSSTSSSATTSSTSVASSAVAAQPTSAAASTSAPGESTDSPAASADLPESSTAAVVASSAAASSAGSDSGASGTGSGSGGKSKSGSGTPTSAAGSAVSGTSTRTATGVAKTVTAILTGYGWASNSPPGPSCYSGICSGEGQGTWDDPGTFASDDSEFKDGTMVYIEPLERYLFKHDSCEQCSDDWSAGNYHLDLWTGANSSSGGESALLACVEAVIPGNGKVIINPPSNLPTKAGSILNAAGKCVGSSSASSSST